MYRTFDEVFILEIPLVALDQPNSHGLELFRDSSSAIIWRVAGMTYVYKGRNKALGPFL